MIKYLYKEAALLIAHMYNPYKKAIERALNTNKRLTKQRKENIMNNPTKDRKRSELISIACSAAFLVCSTVMWFAGQSSSYSPMIMAALIMLCFALLILINTCLPMLMRLGGKYCAGPKAKRALLYQKARSHRAGAKACCSERKTR